MALRLGAVSLMFGLATVPVAVTSALDASPAFAGTPCGTAGVLSVAAGTDTCTYTSAGEGTFAVPTGVTEVMVTAVGGAGGDGLTYTGGTTIVTGAAGGPGAEVTATVPVTGGSTLYPEVGSDGAPATGDATITCSPGAGGANGGGAGGQGNCNDQSGGGGGGASDLRTSTSAALTGVGTDPRLVVAGGGGGGAGGYGTNGGAGGAAGNQSVTGAGGGGSCTSFDDVEAGGTGGVSLGGGAGGTANSTCKGEGSYGPGGAGTAGSGGPGGDGYDVNAVGGGGGGGGFIGGGGGVAVGSGPVGGGGGGGSSFIESSATSFSVTTAGVGATPEVVISWVAPTAPSITSADSTTFTVGTAGTFSVTTTGSPTAAISKSGALPSGVTFTDNGNGTATLAGTPGAGSNASYPITITAANGVGTNATQSFTLDVSDPVSVSNPGAQTSTVGTAVSLQINGTDAESLSLSYSATGLPAGLSISSTSGLISGTPTGPSSPYSVTVTATDTNSASASVMFNWQVNLPTQAPSITSPSSTSFVVGTAGSFAVTTTGDPSGSSMDISESGKLPSGVSFTNNDNGTATLSGTPKTGTKGTYPLTITASNGVSPNATQRFTLYVKYPTTLSVLIAPSPDKVGSALIAVAVLSADDSGGTVSFSVSFDGGPSSPITTCQNKPVYLVVSDCIYTPTSQGTYTISASFSGDTSFAPSSGSASVKTLLPTTLALSFSASPHKGSALVVSAKVSPTPSSGTVAFAVRAPNGQKVSLPASCSSAALSAGVANCSFTPSQDGTYTVSAAYSGNSMDEPSSNNATVKVTG